MYLTPPRLNFGLWLLRTLLALGLAALAWSVPLLHVGGPWLAPVSRLWYMMTPFRVRRPSRVSRLPDCTVPLRGGRTDGGLAPECGRGGPADAGAGGRRPRVDRV